MRKRERVCMYFNIKLSGSVYERECYFEIERERDIERERERE